MEAVQVVRIALNVITDRLLVILALGLSFSLACWTMYFPIWERMGTMAFFSIFSYLIINIKERNQHEKHEGFDTKE
jgi:hypothetical protein